MRMLLAVTALAATLASAAAAEAQDKENPSPIPGWIPDLDAGFAEARKTGKPMFVVFR